ncbi:MAG TPA: hypothetical protein P5051_04410, partial [Methanothrix sp.]|nr:hypothetical protein [Methanothrix sp.]
MVAVRFLSIIKLVIASRDLSASDARSVDEKFCASIIKFTIACPFAGCDAPAIIADKNSARKHHKANDFIYLHLSNQGLIR